MPRRIQDLPEEYLTTQRAIAGAIGARVRVRREELQLKQEQLRARMELEQVFISRTQYSRIENGEALPDAAELIAREQGQGRVLILATAAHRLYAEAIARKLGIQHVVATESVWRGASLMAEIDGENCRGTEKAGRVRACMDSLGLDRSSVSIRCYSDDASDLPCFELADEPVAVNPTRKLSRLAQARRWQILALR